MTRLVWPVFILLLMLLAGSAWSLFGPLNLREFFQSNTAEKSRPTVKSPASKTEPATARTTKEAEPAAAATSKQAESARPDSLPAKFDIARIDPEGTSVFAGRTSPNATVTVFGDGREVGTTTADEQGEWTLAVDHKFASNDPDLEIVAEKPPQSNDSPRPPSKAAAGATEKDVAASTPGDQRETAASSDNNAAEGEQRARETARTVTSNLLKNLEGMVETARISARQETDLDAKVPVAAETDDAAPLAVAAVETSPVVSPTSTSPIVATAPDSAPQAPVTSSSPAVRKTIPVPITFVFNESTLTEDGRKAAALLLEYLNLKKFPKITLTGHADERGSEELNMALSRERLATVERFLREAGFKGKLELIPKGESEPFSGVDRSEYELEDLYQLDRRVELIITR